MSYAGAEIGLYDPCGSLPSQQILRFYVPQDVWQQIISWCQTREHPSPAVAALSHPPPALFLILAFLLPVGTVGEVMAMVMVISHRILEWFESEGTLKII